MGSAHALEGLAQSFCRLRMRASVLAGHARARRRESEPSGGKREHGGIVCVLVQVVLPPGLPGTSSTLVGGAAAHAGAPPLRPHTLAAVESFLCVRSV